MVLIHPASLVLLGDGLVPGSPQGPIKLSAHAHAYSNGVSSPIACFLKYHIPVPIKENTTCEGLLLQMNILGFEATF